MSLFEVADEILRSLNGIFLREAPRRRPVAGELKPFQPDPTGKTSSCSMSTAIPVRSWCQSPNRMDGACRRATDTEQRSWLVP